METVFVQVLNMSLAAGIVILCVLAARLALKAAPKIYSYALWAVVLFRLLCPVSLPSPVSLLELFGPEVVESSEVTTTVSYLPVRYIYSGAGEDSGETVQTRQEAGGMPKAEEPESLSLLDAASYIWAAGIAVMGLYSIVVYARLRWRLLGAMQWRGEVCLADHIDSPFAMGIFRPRIYLPSSVPMRERRYIVAHERHHIRRGDHIIKLLAYTALCIHWFNPLVWTAFLLAGKDMEMSCDEAVIRKLGEHVRADYSASLLRLATHRTVIAGTPLAFGEGDTKGRVRNMAKWKKPKFWVSVLCVIVCIAVLAACALNPAETQTTQVRVNLAASIDGGSVTYGDLKLELPEDYTARIGDDGSILLSRGGTEVGGITHWMTPDIDLIYSMDSLENSNTDEWVSALGIPEARQAIESRETMNSGEMPEEPIAHMIEGGRNYLSAWFCNELYPEKLNVEHNLFITDTVVYDIWHDENVQTDGEAAKYLETTKIGGVPTVLNQSEDTPAETAPEDPGDYHNAFTSADGTLDVTITANIPDEFDSEVAIMDAVPHYLTEEDIRRTACAIFGGDACFTEKAPLLADYNLTEEQIQAAIDRMTLYTDATAWEALCGSGEIQSQSTESYAQTTAQLIEAYQQKLINFRCDYPKQECQWTLKNEGYYIDGYPVEDMNDAIEAYVEKNGISYLFSASTRDKENFKINNIDVMPMWPAGYDELDRRVLYSSLCGTKPTGDQIAAAKAEANRILQEMGLGYWIVDECYVEVIEYHNPDVPEYVIHVNAVPALYDGPEIRFGQRGNINQNSESPTCSDNYYLTQAEFVFAPGGELLNMTVYSPMDLSVASTTNAVWSLEDLLAKAEEELAANSVNDYGLNVDEWGYEGARCRVDVNNIRVGMARVRVQGTEEGYQYVPAMALYGSRTYVFADGNELDNSEDDLNIMTLNALDRTLIQDFNEIYD